MGGGSGGSSQQQTSSQQYTPTSGSGSNSPAIAAGGNVLVTDEGATNNALAGMQTVTLAALNDTSGDTQTALQLLSNFNAGQTAAQLQQQQSDNSLLQSVLASNAGLATASSTGGTSTGLNYSKDVIYAVLALGAVLVIAFLFRK